MGPTRPTHAYETVELYLPIAGGGQVVTAKDRLKRLLLARLGIVGQRAYAYYLAGTTVSRFGNGMQFVATSWLALQLSGASSSVAFVLIATAIPGIVLSPIIGVLVDRLDRRVLAAAMDLACAAVVMSVPVLLWMGVLRTWHLYAMSFLLAVFDQIHNPSAKALVREVVGEDQLLLANATTAVANQVGLLVGSGVSGLIIAAFSAGAAMGVNSATFLVSAGCTFAMRGGWVASVREKTDARGWGAFRSEMGDGLAYIRSRRHIAVVYLLMLFLFSTLQTINVLLAPFAKNVLNVGARGFGYIDAAFAAGAIIGGLLLPLAVHTMGRRTVMVGGIWALAASLLLFSLARGLIIAILGYFCIGAFFQVWVMYLSKAQESTSLRYQGRVYAVFETLDAAVSLVIYAAMGLLADVVSPRWLYVSQAVLLGGAGFLAYKSRNIGGPDHVPADA